ncbi:hypothetical protein [Brevibacillus agri]|nr:hypothetical protein [Brevibacillus agri]
MIDDLLVYHALPPLQDLVDPHFHPWREDVQKKVGWYHPGMLKLDRVQSEHGKGVNRINDDLLPSLHLLALEEKIEKGKHQHQD